MEDRIARHRARRGAEWETVAEPLDLVRALADTDGGAPRLVDCVDAVAVEPDARRA